MWNVECLFLEFFHLFPGFLICLMQAFICSTDLPSEQTDKPLLAFSDCGGQLHHIITYYFPLQGTPTLYEGNNTYCGTDRCLRQSAGNRRGGTLMEERWEQSWWGIGTLMLPAALSCHSLACPAVLAQAEVQRLNHRGRSGRPGHLIYLFDHRSALGERHCVPSFFIKIGLNGLFLCLGEKRNRDGGDIKGYWRPQTRTHSSFYLHNKFKEESLTKESSFWLELAWFDFKTERSSMVDGLNSHMDVLIKPDCRFWLKQEESFIPHNTNEETTIAWWVFLIQCLIQISVNVLQEKIFLSVKRLGPTVNESN